MRKIIVLIIVFLWLFNTTFAHPLDISVSTANIKWNNLSITTYFHTFEIEYLLKNNGIETDWVIDYYENSRYIIEYVESKNKLINNWNVCEIRKIELIEDEAYKIVTDWLWISYSFKCSEKIEKFNLEFNYFNEFPLQTNRITLYNLNNWIKNLKPIIYKVLTSKITTLSIDINNLDIKRIDTDNDWLSDEEEKIYFTDPGNIDTDWDYYTDKEEIDFWWNPLNKELWPGQDYREKLDIQKSNNNVDSLKKISSEIENKNLSDYWYWNGYLKSVMKYMNDYFNDNNWSIYWVFFAIFFLWILHAIWPWHSKWLLIAFTLDKDNWYKKWLLFAFIFTVTHMIDIILLFFVTKIIITFIDPSKYSYYLQLSSWVILFILSLYLIYKSVNRKPKQSSKPSLYVAFLAWLAPCSFAWSIYLLLIALGKSSWIIPLVFALWLWILTTLISIVIISVYLKNKAYNKVQKIWNYSSILSSIIIFIISILILVNILIF